MTERARDERGGYRNLENITWEKGCCYHVRGQKEMYVWVTSNGAQIAVKAGDEWEFDEVTSEWSIPSEYYLEAKRVDTDEFPTYP